MKETFGFFKKRNLPFPVWGLWLQNHQHFHSIVGNSLQSENDILLTYIYILQSAIRHEIGYTENKYGKNILYSDLFHENLPAGLISIRQRILLLFFELFSHKIHSVTLDLLPMSLFAIMMKWYAEIFMIYVLNIKYDHHKDQFGWAHLSVSRRCR